MNTEKKFLIVANWKMNQSRVSEAQKTASEIAKKAKKYKNTSVVICPSHIHIPIVSKALGKSSVILGAQSVFAQGELSPTGEVSIAQIADFDVRYCIVGHSDQRLLGQTNKQIAETVFKLIKKGITPILCIGEEKRDKEGTYLKNLTTQIQESLFGIPSSMVSKIIFAYEPLWAIGSSAKRNANAGEVEEVAILIKRALSDMYTMKKLPSNTILYGGSVSHAQDVNETMKTGQINGFLVGRASLSAKTFLPLVEELDKNI